MPSYMNALIPLMVGVVILAFPQIFTKKDLTQKENMPARKKIQIIGIAAIILSVVIFLKGTAFK
ncbi:MAG: hypothetical protein PHT53_03405 [Candidatus Omnitrophica bacterium]|nr:hypothetical protein [Candidatus Omnitrophota bacterium]